MNNTIESLMHVSKAYVYNNLDTVNSLSDFQDNCLTKLIELVAKECILTIQLQICRNGNTPENIRSYKHIDDIAKKFNIILPINYVGVDSIVLPLPFNIGKLIHRDLVTFQETIDHPILDIGSSCSGLKEEVIYWLNQNIHSGWKFDYQNHNYCLVFNDSGDYSKFADFWLTDDKWSTIKEQIREQFVLDT